MRQEGEFLFCKALNNIAEGCMDEELIALIKSREISSTNLPPSKYIHLFATNRDCKEYNSKVYSELNTEGAKSTAHDGILITETSESLMSKKSNVQ